MAKPVKFSEIEVNTPFTPVPGSIGASQVFVKKPNGICPVVSKENHRDDSIEQGRFLQEAIFFPSDKVYASFLPPKILERYA
ncbi:MAG: hypothetical protein ACREAE_02600 [Nitrosopumilaceae archaeon]